MKNHTDLPSIKVKGHDVALEINHVTGVFVATLDDGEKISHLTLSDLKKELRSRLETKEKEPRVAVDCYYLDTWEGLCPAQYVGKHKSKGYSPFMFDVVLPKGEKKREMESESGVRNKIYSTNMDLNVYRSKKKAVMDAERDLGVFLKKNAFDPTR
jgi:hypothetical protein